MRDVLRISAQGFSTCPSCARHVLLEDEVERTRCPFCGAGILDDPPEYADRLLRLERLGGVVGRTAAELRRAGGPAPAPGPPRDPGMNGDPDLLRRMGGDTQTTGVRHAVWEITLACDLGCTHCGSRAGRARSDELSTAECFDLVDQLRDLGVREVTLIGGEAYLRDDWARIAERIVTSGMLCTMTTGARELNEARVQAAADAGIGSIGISIDGLEFTHDALRGARGSWRAAVDAAHRVSRSPVRLATNSQINALSAPELPALARLLVEIGSTAWQVQLTVPMGRAADRPAVLLQPRELLQVYPLLIWVREHILDPHGIAFVPGNNIGYFSPMEQDLRYGGDIGAHWTACGAGQHVIGIEADGRIKGCPSLPTASYVGGTVRESPLREIVKERPALTAIKHRTRADLWGFCRDCHYADVCTAGCTWTSDSVMGRPGNNPFCSHRAMTKAASGVEERIVQVERPVGQPFDTGRFDIVERPLESGSDNGTWWGVDLRRILEAQPHDGSVRPREAFPLLLAKPQNVSPMRMFTRGVVA